MSHGQAYFDQAESFVVKIYDITSDAVSVDDVRVKMFHRISKPEKLPPTHDALVLHLQRAQYQAAVWAGASHPISTLPGPETCG